MTVTAVECPGQSGFPDADPGAQALLISGGALCLGCGAYAVRRYRPGWLKLWLAALVVWGTLCKYLICTRCERYGQACDYCYGGRYAARLFKRQPGRQLDAWGILAEGSSGAVLMFLPILAAMKSRRLLVSYLAILGLWQGALIRLCCSRCVEHATDPWKARYCPNYWIASQLRRSLSPAATAP